MTPLDPPKDLTRSMGMALWVVLASAVVIAASYLAELPGWLLGTALLCGVAGIVGLGLLTYRQARATGSGFWRSLGRALRRMLGAALDLFV